MNKLLLESLQTAFKHEITKDENGRAVILKTKSLVMVINKKKKRPSSLELNDLDENPKALCMARSAWPTRAVPDFQLFLCHS